MEKNNQVTNPEVKDELKQNSNESPLFIDSSNPPLPVQFPGSNETSYNNPYPSGVPAFIFQDHPQAQYAYSTSRSLDEIMPKPEESPRFFENFWHHAKEANREFQAGEFLVNQLSPNNLQEVVPEGWKVKPEDLAGFDEKYWYHLLNDSTGPKSLEANKQAVREQMKKDDYFSKGGWISALAGGFVGSILSPSELYTLKFLNVAKYATVGKTMLMNAMSTAPAISLGAFATNALNQANRVGGSLETAAYNSVTDTVFGTALMGLGSGVARYSHELKLWDTRKALTEYTQKGIKIDPVIKDGKLTGEINVSSAPGTSLSAAEVDSAKALWQDEFAKSGFFKLPGVQKFFEKTSTIPGIQSPQFQAAFNKFKNARSFYYRIYGSTSFTAGEILGFASKHSADTLSYQYSKEAHSFTRFYQQKFKEANGVTGNTAAAKLKNMEQVITRNRSISHQDLGKETLKILSNKAYKSEYSQAHELADEMHNAFVRINEINSRLTGRPLFQDPRNAWRYFPVKDNVSEMINGKPRWRELSYELTEQQDNRINAVLQPIKNTKARIKKINDLIKNLDKDGPLYKQYQEELKSQRGNLKRQEADYEDLVLNNQDYNILLEDRNPLTAQERNELRTLLEPIKTFEKAEKSAIKTKEKSERKEAKAIKDKKIAEDKEAKALKAKEKAKSDKAKTKADKEILRANNAKSKADKDLIMAREEKSNAEKEIAKAIEDKEDFLSRLTDEAHEGKLNPKFYNEHGFEIKFDVDPNVLPKLRAPHASERDRWLAVDALWESKMNMTPNDLVTSIFGQLNPSVGMPNHFKARTNMLPVEDYVREGFQDTNIQSLMTSYLQVVGRDLAFKEAFPEFSRAKNFDTVLRGLKQEYDTMSAELYKAPRTKERDKEATRLQQDYEKARQFMSDTYNAYFGIGNQNVNSTVKAMIGIGRNITSASLMGGIVAYQLQDLGAIFMKQGIMNTFSAGLKPLIKSFAQSLSQQKGEAKELMLNAAAHAGLAANTTMMGLSMKHFNPSVIDMPAGKAMLTRALNASERTAHYSMNFFGVNYLQDKLEMITASAFQSRVMKAMHDFKAGKLAESELQAMAHYGVDVRNDADIFLKNMKEAGGYQEGRSFQSMYWKWSDNEATVKMGGAIRRAVKDTVLDSNAFMSPYWSKDPLFSLIFMFHGWAYNAFARYTVPLMQRPNAEAILGTAVMIGLAMMVDPLKRLANGKEMFKEDDTWFNAALRGLDNSGLPGQNWDLISNVNKFLGDPLFESTEKRANYNAHDSIYGPVLGTAFGIGDATSHFIKGQTNQSDVKKLTRVMPGASQVAVKQLIDYFIKNSGLPEKRPKKGGRPVSQQLGDFFE